MKLNTLRGGFSFRSLKGLAVLAFLLLSTHLFAQHPRIYVSNSDRQEILQKIEQQGWAESSWDNLIKDITPYVDRHVNDPEWIVSRLAMYWKEGEHYTQCYIKNQDWDYGEGNAPLPTVRLPGMRRWNDYVNVPLEDRIPYNETGDLLGISRSNGDPAHVLIPYKETGHMIRQNNMEILKMAEQSAFAYWVTQDEKYAKFSADILWTWLLGTYYMEPIKDPEKSSKGYGGYEAGGILGYYDYEVIHDDRQDPAAATYDFIHDYMVANPHPYLKNLDMTGPQLAGTVFKRFIEIGLVRGGRLGNWNVNRYRHLMNSILCLESNDFYEDGKGQEYYIPFYLEMKTEQLAPLPEIMDFYDHVTGLWPESPGYASSMIPTVLQMGIKLYNNDINTIADYPMVQKAAMANLGWLDARGNLVVFGDMRGGPPSIEAFEYLLTYYTKEGETEKAKEVATVIKKAVDNGQYARDASEFSGICLNQSLDIAGETLPYNRTAYSAFHRHMIMKNGNDTENGMMFTLYGGMYQHHLSQNGLAVQFYGKGYALAPDASAYESYWTKDKAYHSSTTGCNTILPGYTKGPVTVNAMDPAVDTTAGLYNANATSAYCSFTDMSAAEKRRSVLMVRTGATTGYYVDIFRSNQEDNDYLFHNLGQTMTITDASATALELAASDDLGNEYNHAYSFFSNQKKCSHDNDFIASWKITGLEKDLNMNLWMLGQENRSLYSIDGLPTTLRSDLTPAQVNKAPELTPTLIVRQSGNNADKHPFVAVYESYYEGEQNVAAVTKLKESDNFTSLQVSSRDKQEQVICQATDDAVYKVTKDVQFQGTLAVVSTKDGDFDYLYLGKGKEVTYGKYRIAAVEGDVSAEIHEHRGKFYYSSDKPVYIQLRKGRTTLYQAGYNVLIK